LGMDRFQEWLRRLGECLPRSNTPNFNSPTVGP
jgi:hypothetical protein